MISPFEFLEYGFVHYQKDFWVPSFHSAIHIFRISRPRYKISSEPLTIFFSVASNFLFGYFDLLFSVFCHYWKETETPDFVLLLQVEQTCLTDW
jgi:hypothetical protein